MKKNLVELVDAILQNSPLLTDASDSGLSFDSLTSNSALLSDSYDNGLSFGSLSTNMPVASLALTYNLWYKPLLEDDIFTSELFKRKVWFHRLFNEEVESLDSIAKVHEPLTLDTQFFFADHDEIETKLIRGNRYLELLYTSENFFSPKAVSPQEKIYTNANSFAKEWGEDLGIEEAFADSTQIDILPFRGRTYRDYAIADEDLLVAANSAILWDKFFAADNYTSKNANAVVDDVAYFNFTEDDFTLIHGQSSSLEEVLVADSVLNPSWAFVRDRVYTGNEDLFFTQKIHLSELRADRDPDDPNEFVYSEELASIKSNSVSEDIANIKDLIKNPKWAGLFDRIFETDSRHNSPNLQFISKKATEASQLGQNRKGEEISAMSGGYGARHLRKLTKEGLIDNIRLPTYNIEPLYIEAVHDKDWSLVSFDIDKNLFEPVLIPAKSGQVIYGKAHHLLDRFFLEDKDDILLFHKVLNQTSQDIANRKGDYDKVFLSGDRSNHEDIYFHVDKASILEDYYLKDKIVNVANSSTVQADRAFLRTEKPAKKHTIWKMLPQEFFPKNSYFGGSRSKTGIYHSLYSDPRFIARNSYGAIIKRFFPTDTTRARAGEAPWEDYAIADSDGGGAWYLESSYGPVKYTWVRTGASGNPDIGRWTYNGFTRSGFGTSGSRRTNFYVRPPTGDEFTRRYTPFTGTPYIISYSNGKLLKSGIIALGLNHYVESFAGIESKKALANLSMPLLLDRFYLSANDIEVRLIPEYQDFVDLLEAIRKRQELLLDPETILAKDPTAIANLSIPIVSDSAYWGNDVYDLDLFKQIHIDRIETEDSPSSFFSTEKEEDSLLLNSSLHNVAKFVPIKDEFFFYENLDHISPVLQLFDSENANTLKHTVHSKDSLIRTLNYSTPETSPILNESTELSTRVDYIRDEIYRDSVNVKGSKELDWNKLFSIGSFYNYNLRNSYTVTVTRTFSFDISSQIEDPSILQNYSIHSIALFGTSHYSSSLQRELSRPSSLQVAGPEGTFKTYGFTENEWKGETSYSADVFVLSIKIPYTRYYRYGGFDPNIDNFSITLNLTANFTGGNIELIGRPSEYPFVNNIQSADSGSAFINNYCLEYFYEAYVGEEGTYANF